MKLQYISRSLTFLMVFFLFLGLGNYYFFSGKVQSRLPAQENVDQSSFGWKVTLMEDFLSAEEQIRSGVPSECFTKMPNCKVHGWRYEDCAAEESKHLYDLNKCIWTVYKMYNWMDFDIAEGKGINAFDPKQVEIKNGNLILKANKNPNYTGSWDCKNFYTNRWGEQVHTTHCPVLSGAIDSRVDKGRDMAGFEQAYGRFEVRGRLSNGPGTWPAFWMLPGGNFKTRVIEYSGDQGGCGWPYDGEFDLLETWSDKPYTPKQNYHTGHCVEDIKMNAGFAAPRSKSFVDDFHIYALEWTPHYIAFWVDDEITGVVRVGDMDTGKYREGPHKGEKSDPRPHWIPSYAFYMILNLSIEGTKSKEKLVPKYETFQEQKLYVDYVKVYARCTEDDDPEVCVELETLGSKTVDEYQSHARWETTKAELTAYPNPVRRGATANVRFRSEEHCQDVRISLVNMSGQILETLYQGTSEQGEDIYTEFNSGRYPSGTYILKSDFQACGVDLNLQGNQVFKFLIL